MYSPARIQGLAAAVDAWAGASVDPAELRRRAQGIYSVEWEQAQGCEWDGGWRDKDAGWCEEWDGKRYWVDEERTVEVKVLG